MTELERGALQVDITSGDDTVSAVIAHLKSKLLSFIRPPCRGRLLRRPPRPGQDPLQATRQLANRWVGILHALLERRQPYRAEIAWPEREELLPAAA